MRTLSSRNNIWIGGIRDAIYSSTFLNGYYTFKWTDGSVFEDFIDFAPEEPNMLNDKEFCLAQRGEDGKWNDLSCDVGLPFVCQVDAKLQHTGRY